MIKSSFKYAVSLMTNVIVQWKSLTINRCAMIDFLNMRNDDMMSSTTLMISTKMMYLQLFEFVMRDEDFFVINVMITQLFSHSIQKSVSFMFHVFDDWMSYWFITLFNCLKYCFSVDIQSAFFLCTTIDRWRRLLRSGLRSRKRFVHKIFTGAAFECASRST